MLPARYDDDDDEELQLLLVPASPACFYFYSFLGKIYLSIYLFIYANLDLFSSFGVEGYSLFKIAQSAGAVEYTECFSVEG